MTLKLKLQTSNFFTLIFGICKKNILICSQVKFEPDEPNSFLPRGH